MAHQLSVGAFAASLLLSCALPSAHAQTRETHVVATLPTTSTTVAPERMMFTTYFYTAGEAVIQGYEAGTNFRVFRLDTHEPIFAGTVGTGESQLVPTGPGVFGFASDKKAAILVGTPSSCTVVGYWARDADGAFVSDRLFLSLPASTLNEDDRVVVWTTEASHVTVRDRQGERVLFDGELPARGRFVIPHAQLGAMGSHVLDIRSNHRSVAAQVYYDEGFTVPSANGRTSGRDFTTYVGRTTEGLNDVVMSSANATAHVRVVDMDSHEVLFEGGIEAGHVHALTLHEKYVQVTSDRDIGVAVVPYVHYTGAYAEHHFAGGAEGTGIDTDFIITSPNDLWLFSYFGNNAITIDEIATGRRVWEGNLGAGASTGLTPGHGLYRVRATRGMSVMGGANSCGGEYSPAGRLFAVDEAVMRAVAQVYETRRVEAAARGVAMDSHAAAAAPLTAAEVSRVTDSVRRATGSASYDAPAVMERIEATRAP